MFCTTEIRCFVFCISEIRCFVFCTTEIRVKGRYMRYTVEWVDWEVTFVAVAVRRGGDSTRRR